jgi:hypothetical protein
MLLVAAFVFVYYTTWAIILVRGRAFPCFLSALIRDTSLSFPPTIPFRAFSHLENGLYGYRHSCYALDWLPLGRL